MSVKKVAIFVEGQTEQIFLQKLLEEIAGKHKIRAALITHKTTQWATLHLLQTPTGAPELSYFVLLVNCQNDEKVKSVVLERRASLEQKGYSLILGLRDLYPNKLADLTRVTQKLAYGVPTGGVPTQILLAVAEVEAWFLQDFTHYSKIDPLLDHFTFKAKFKFDPVTDSAESISCPAELLHTIYASASKAYKKSRNQVQRTVDSLDYAQMYLTYPAKLPHLRQFIAHIDAFFQASAATSSAP